MTDATARKPLRVSTEGTAGPYINLPFSQLDEVRRVLDCGGIRYWVSENAISFDGGPEYIDINFGRDGDAAAVQAILDSAGSKVSPAAQADSIRVLRDRVVADLNAAIDYFQAMGEEGEQKMTDATTKKLFRVSTESKAGPYIRLQVSQLDEVRRLLDNKGIRYWISENAISLDGGPEYTIVNLGRGGDGVAVQAILDGAG